MLKLFRNSALAVGMGLSSPQMASAWPAWYTGDGRADCTDVTEEVCANREYLAEQFREAEEWGRAAPDLEKAQDALNDAVRSTTRRFGQAVARTIDALEAAEADRADRAGDAIRDGINRRQGEAPDRDERMQDRGGLQDMAPNPDLTPIF